MAAAADAALRAAFPAATEVSVVDFSDSGCDGSKLAVRVVSTEFEGLALLARHRAVNAAVAHLMAGIHALTIKALTPTQAAAAVAAAPAAAPK